MVLQCARLCGLTFEPLKVVITPVNSIPFGWQKKGDGWRPTTHTISPLASAQPPPTVKQLRSWLGSYKKLASSIPNYAVLLAPLEETVTGRGSAEKIAWSTDLELAFNKAKESLHNISTVFVPKPSDSLHTF